MYYIDDKTCLIRPVAESLTVMEYIVQSTSGESKQTRIPLFPKHPIVYR